MPGAVQAVTHAVHAVTRAVLAAAAVPAAAVPAAAVVAVAAAALAAAAPAVAAAAAVAAVLGDAVQLQLKQRALRCAGSHLVVSCLQTQTLQPTR